MLVFDWSLLWIWGHDHFQRDCPRGSVTVALAQTERSTPVAQRGRRPSRIEAAGGSQKATSETVERPEAKAPIGETGG